MKYGCVKEFHHIDWELYADYNKGSIARGMACDIIQNMSEEDFLKLFEVNMFDRNMDYCSPIVMEVKLTIK